MLFKQPRYNIILPGPPYMHWYCCNSFIPVLSESKSLIYQPALDFTHVYLQSVSLHAVRPGCAKYWALKITLNYILLCPIYKTVVSKMIIFLLHH